MLQAGKRISKHNIIMETQSIKQDTAVEFLHALQLVAQPLGDAKPSIGVLGRASLGYRAD
jgi:hypothetical protein